MDIPKHPALDFTIRRPYLLGEQKGGSLRMCINHRAPDKTTIKNAY